MRTSFASTAILRAIAAGNRYGFDVMDATGLASGTVYPALRRLEKHGLVVGRWEDEEGARRAGRPRRRYYELTPVGAEALDRALERFRSLPALDGLFPGDAEA